MKSNLFRINYILIVTALFSCNSSSLDNISSGNCKFYFINLQEYKGMIDTSNYLNSYRNFYIDDTTFLKIYKEEIIKENVPQYRADYKYSIEIIQDNTVKYSSLLNVEQGIIHESHTYKIDINRLKEYAQKAKKLDSYRVNCNSIKGTKMLINAFEKQGVYIFGKTGVSFGVDNYHVYNGRMTLALKPVIYKVSYFEDELKTSTSEDSLVVVEGYGGGHDLYHIKVLCMRDLSGKLPSGYEIIEGFTDSVEVPFDLYGISREDIEETLRLYGITNYTIEDINNNNYWQQ